MTAWAAMTAARAIVATDAISNTTAEAFLAADEAAALYTYALRDDQA
jgi:hypothetical protein